MTRRAGNAMAIAGVMLIPLAFTSLLYNPIALLYLLPLACALILLGMIAPPAD